MPSRSLDDLHEVMQAPAKAWLGECRASGLDPLVYCTYRSNEEQDALHAQGRTAPGRIVTYARPGKSAHNYGLALDFVPMVGGKPDWSGKHPHWEACILIAESHGLESASRWKKFKEKPHLQMPNWRQYL